MDPGSNHPEDVDILSQSPRSTLDDNFIDLAGDEDSYQSDEGAMILSVESRRTPPRSHSSHAPNNSEAFVIGSRTLHPRRRASTPIRVDIPGYADSPRQQSGLQRRGLEVLLSRSRRTRAARHRARQRANATLIMGPRVSSPSTGTEAGYLNAPLLQGNQTRSNSRFSHPLSQISAGVHRPVIAGLWSRDSTAAMIIRDDLKQATGIDLAAIELDGLLSYYDSRPSINLYANLLIQLALIYATFGEHSQEDSLAMALTLRMLANQQAGSDFNPRQMTVIQFAISTLGFHLSAVALAQLHPLFSESPSRPSTSNFHEADSINTVLARSMDDWTAKQAPILETEKLPTPPEVRAGYIGGFNGTASGGGCVMCHQQLGVAAASTEAPDSETEGQSRQVFMRRCGHLYCGCCVAKISSKEKPGPCVVIACRKRGKRQLFVQLFF